MDGTNADGTDMYCVVAVLPIIARTLFDQQKQLVGDQRSL